MATALENYGFGSRWTEIHTDSYRGYSPRMTDYHMHAYYEISLILSGHVHVLLSDRKHSGTQPVMVLLRPYTPHYIHCESDLLYSRNNICFRQDFLGDCDPKWQKLLHVFAKNGAVLPLTDEQCRQYAELFQRLHDDGDPFRKKLLLLYFLSLVADGIPGTGGFSQVPEYVTEALSYIGSHYDRHIVAGELAEQLGVGRTTLMSAFKQHTGVTVNEYLTNCRLKHAISMLQDGKSQQETAERCGFSDPCNLIRCFNRVFGMPPRRYLAALSAESER